MAAIAIALALLFWTAGWRVGLILLLVAVVLGLAGGTPGDDDEIPRAK